MTPQVRVETGVLVYSILLNIPINYHPMILLPSIASSNNISDLFTRPLPTTTHHRLVTLIGAAPTVNPTATATLAAAPTVDTVPTVVASPATVDSLATAVDPPSDLVPHPVPYFVDTGASLPVIPSYSDLLPVTQAPFGLIRSAASVAYSSDSKASSKASTHSNDPYTLITGEDTTTDLSSPDLFDSDSEIASAFEVLEVREFGTATLIFISYPHSEL